MRLQQPLIARTLTGLAAALALSTSFAQDSKPEPAPAPAAQPLIFSSQAVRYRCDAGAEIELAYLNLSNGTTFAALHFDGRTFMLQGRRATTGVRFFALDEQYKLSWYTQGMKGELSVLTADPSAQDKTLLSNCFAQPAHKR